MKRNTTTLIIKADIGLLAFDKYNWIEEVRQLGNSIRYFGKGTFDYYSVKYITTKIQDTSLENRKIIIFVYELNISNSNYENNILVNLCLNLQKAFNEKSLICDTANQCYILETYNSRLDK